MKILFDTLGCDKNTADNEYLAGLLRDKGVEIANRTGARDFDAVIITTCGFIEEAREQSLQTIRRWTHEKERRRRPLTVFVSGCLTQKDSESLQKEIPGIDGLAGVGNFDRVADMIAEALKKQADGERPAPFCEIADTPEAAIAYDIPREPLYDAPYAFLKISDGCDHTCTFCAIPSMKGLHRSNPRERVLAEARRLVESGVRELNLIAQDCSDYGKDLYGREYGLEHLVRDLCAIEGDFWVRLFYLYPLGVTDGLMQLWRDEPKFLRYVDMPLQHLAPGVLRRMKRPHLEARVDATIDRLRTLDGFTLRTTLIVGFPGETDEDVATLLDGMSRHRFDRLGVFAYSHEASTPSGSMPDQIDEAEKRRRRNLVMRRQAEISAELMAARVGRREKVLIESFDAERRVWTARGASEAPEIDGQVLIQAGRKALKKGEFAEVEILKADLYDVVAKIA